MRRDRRPAAEANRTTTASTRIKGGNSLASAEPYAALAEACLRSRRGLAQGIVGGARFLAVSNRVHSSARMRSGLVLESADGDRVHVFRVAS